MIMNTASVRVGMVVLWALDELDWPISYANFIHM